MFSKPYRFSVSFYSDRMASEQFSKVSYHASNTDNEEDLIGVLLDGTYNVGKSEGNLNQSSAN